MLSMNLFVTAILALLATAPALARSTGRMVLADTNVTIPDCPANIPVTSTDVPGVSPTMVLQVVRGTRNFTCTNNQLNDGYSEASAKVDDNTPNISGDFFYDSIGFPTFTLDVGGSSKFVPRKIVLFKEYLETPSPSGPNVYPWARWKVLSDTGSPPFAYVERRDTTEGGLPASTCTGPTATSPFGGKFNFYACNPPGVSPPLPKSPPAVRASPPVVPVPSTEAASIVATPAGAPTSNKPPAAAVVAASPTTPPSGAHSIFSVQAVVMAFMSAAIGFMW